MNPGKYKKLIVTPGIFSLIFGNNLLAQYSLTYAQKSGWQREDRVVMFLVDDAGISSESNERAIRSVEKGIAGSMSVRMPCPWTSPMIRYLKNHPETDGGLHLTHSSEWEDYSRDPLSGIYTSPGLTDQEGVPRRSGENVLHNATPDEVETEIKAQPEKARKMGFNPTHPDTHMGTLRASPGYLERYIKLVLRSTSLFYLPPATLPYYDRA